MFPPKAVSIIIQKFKSRRARQNQESLTVRNDSELRVNQIHKLIGEEVNL